MRTALFWVITQQRVVNTDVSAQPINPIKTEPIGCAKTSVRYYYYPLRNNQEERSSQLIILGFLMFLISVRNVPGLNEN